MVSAILSRVVILVFGTLYPAYESYKAVKTKNVKEYVKWMMYWIVFALFCAIETFADVFLSWLPFYYEVKIIFVFWLLSPVTRGSSFIYRKFVHPQLAKREKEIDEAIAQARTRGYSTLMTLGHRGLTYATNVVVNTAIKGQSTLVEQIKKSYSTNDLRVKDRNRGRDDVDGIAYIDDSDDEFGLVYQEMPNDMQNLDYQSQTETSRSNSHTETSRSNSQTETSRSNSQTEMSRSNPQTENSNSQTETMSSKGQTESPSLKALVETSSSKPETETSGSKPQTESVRSKTKSGTSSSTHRARYKVLPKNTAGKTKSTPKKGNGTIFLITRWMGF